MKLNFFASIAEAAAYMAEELLATLNEDLRRMERKEFHFYSDADREEMRARIGDLEEVAPLVAAAFAEKSAPQTTEPHTPAEGEVGYVVEYELPYTHRVQVGVYATDAEDAAEKAEEAFYAGALWDNTPEMPLLFDEYEEEGDAGTPLEFRVVAMGAFPEPEGSVRQYMRDQKARAALSALEKGDIAEALRLAKE